MLLFLSSVCLLLAACQAGRAPEQVLVSDQSRNTAHKARATMDNSRTARGNSQCPSPVTNEDLMEEIKSLKAAIDQAPFEYKQVYPVTLVSANEDYSYKYTYEEAEQACKDRGTVLATFSQMEAAFNNGLDMCSCGWVEGRTSVFPIIYPRTGCFIDEAPGLRGCIWGENKWNAWCFDKDVANKMGLF